jgi:hypothetical protein
VTKNLLSRAPPCFGRHVKPLVPVAFAVVSTLQPALGPCGGLCVIHKEGLCPSSGDINRLMIVMMVEIESHEVAYVPRIDAMRWRIFIFIYMTVTSTNIRYSITCK